MGAHGLLKRRFLGSQSRRRETRKSKAHKIGAKEWVSAVNN
jgi:hypothetical protein